MRHPALGAAARPYQLLLNSGFASEGYISLSEPAYSSDLSDSDNQAKASALRMFIDEIYDLFNNVNVLYDGKLNALKIVRAIADISIMEFQAYLSLYKENNTRSDSGR